MMLVARNNSIKRKRPPIESWWSADCARVQSGWWNSSQDRPRTRTIPKRPLVAT